MRGCGVDWDDPNKREAGEDVLDEGLVMVISLAKAPLKKGWMCAQLASC